MTPLQELFGDSARAETVLNYDILIAESKKVDSDFCPQTQMKTMVILHGILSCRKNWTDFSQKLLELCPKLRIVLVDLRGHGESVYYRDGNSTVSNCAKDLRKLFYKLKIRPDVLLGHCLGGKVAMCYLRLCREKCLPEPAEAWFLDVLPGCDPAAQETLNGLMGNALTVMQGFSRSNKTRKEIIKSMIQQGYQESWSRWITANLKVSQSLREFLMEDVENNLWSINFPVVQELWSSHLKEQCWDVFQGGLKTQMHLVIASKNEVWTAAHYERLQTHQREEEGFLQCHVLENAGHFVHFDKPTELMDLVSKVLQD